MSKVALIKLALAGHKSSGFAWRSHLTETSWSQEYYEYVLAYTDGILAVSMNSTNILVDQHYMLNSNSIGPPTQYFGAQIGKYTIPDNPDNPKWHMSSENMLRKLLGMFRIG
jgi:hypothetical protein